MVINANQRLLIGRELLREAIEEKPYLERVLERVCKRTDQFVDLEHEKENYELMMKQVFGETDRIPSEYKKVVEPSIKNVLEIIKNSMISTHSTTDLYSPMSIDTPGEFLQRKLTKTLSDRSFKVLEGGCLKNIHTEEYIYLESKTTIASIIKTLQSISRETRIDSLLPEEKVREIAGTDELGYEMTGLEDIRQKYLNGIRCLGLAFDEVPIELPEELQEEMKEEVKSSYAANQEKIASYSKQIKHNSEEKTVQYKK